MLGIIWFDVDAKDRLSSNCFIGITYLSNITIKQCERILSCY